MMKSRNYTLALAVGTALATAPAAAVANPFGLSDLGAGYMLGAAVAADPAPAAKDAEGKCGEDKAKKDAEGKCGEGKCGEDMDKAKKDGEGSCGEDKAEAKDGEGKCGA